jgi:Zn-dependent peptidase ImmA (M78 family)/transcriptional regulator with XRE-family HTH domain
MAKSIPSHATPLMLQWAREKVPLSIPDAARALNISEQTLIDWESGNESPTIAKLRAVAKRYKRPLMFFYLASPPKGFSPVRDFRTLRNGNPGFSPTLTLAIRVAQEHQAWAEDVLRDDGERRLNYVGSKTVESSAPEVAAEIRHKLGITTDIVSQLKGPDEAFRLWKSRIESIGCFVFQVPKVAVTEMRGFALPNPFAPAIALNIRDRVQARIFTMIHELCHIYLGESGVSGAGKLQFSPSTRNPVEKFCNRVAAATLVPMKDLKQRVPKGWEFRPDQIVGELAAFYKVTRPVMLIRLFEAGVANSQYVRSKFPVFNRPPREKKRPKRDGGPRWAQVVLSRNGQAFSRLVLATYQSGVIHGGELSSLLNMKMQHLSSLEKKLFSRQQTGPP